MSEQGIDEALRALRYKLAASEHSGAIGVLSSSATKLARNTDDPVLLLAIAEFIDHAHEKLEHIRAHQPKRLRVSAPTNTMPMIKMRIGAWRIDELGNKTREITSEEIIPAA